MGAKTYQVSGFFSKRSVRQRFSTQVHGTKKEEAIEKILSEIGGRFKVKRSMIKVEKLEEVQPEKPSK